MLKSLISRFTRGGGAGGRPATGGGARGGAARGGGRSQDEAIGRGLRKLFRRVR